MELKFIEQVVQSRPKPYLLLIVFWLLLLISLIDIPRKLKENLPKDVNIFSKPFIHLQNTTWEDEAFAFIPAATVDKWAQTEFLIVFGVSSVDNDERRRRRALQRATCWTFPGVATRVNDYNGSLLVLYALALHPAHGFALSESLRLEAAQWHDIISLPVEDEGVTTEVEIGDGDKSVDDAKFKMTKKTFFWFLLALQAFPLAFHLGKSYDHMFINVPKYLAELRLFPEHGTYWGPYTGGIVLQNKQMENDDVRLMVGFSVALARNVAEELVT